MGSIKVYRAGELELSMVRRKACVHHNKTGYRRPARIAERVHLSVDRLIGRVHWIAGTERLSPLFPARRPGGLLADAAGILLFAQADSLWLAISAVSAVVFVALTRETYCRLRFDSDD